MNHKIESPADIPLIFGLCNQIDLTKLINDVYKTHGNQSGLNIGQIITVLISYVLTENNHCKSPVADWVMKNKMTLQSLIKTEINDLDFDDSRLSRVIDKMADDKLWHEFEKIFYKNTLCIFQLNTNPPDHFKDPSCKENEGIKGTIKCDATTAYGYHEVVDNKIMQFGWSKINRPDLPQIKLMFTVEGNTGIQIASDVVAGNINDDPLYIPIIEKTRDIIETKNCLFLGDCKMSSIETRSNIQKNNEFYLAPLQLNNKKEFNKLVDAVVNGNQLAELIWSESQKTGENTIVGAGYETTRIQLHDNNDGNIIEWNERMLLIRSYDHLKSEIKQLKERIKKQKIKLLECKSNLHLNEVDAKKDIESKIEKIKEENELASVFKLEFKILEENKIYKRKEKRNGKKRNGSYKLKKFRVIVSSAMEDSLKVKEMERKLGWRIYVTNAPENYLNFSSAYKYYRETMYVVEIGFHVIKDHINISPLYVSNQNQIVGMTRLLILALKLLTSMTALIRTNMKKEKIVLQGLYPGQPKRFHESPTAQSILKFFSRQEIHLVGTKCTEIESKACEILVEQKIEMIESLNNEKIPSPTIEKIEPVQFNNISTEFIVDNGESKIIENPTCENFAQQNNMKVEPLSKEGMPVFTIEKIEPLCNECIHPQFMKKIEPAQFNNISPGSIVDNKEQEINNDLSKIYFKWEISPLSDKCRLILKLLQIPEEIYSGIPEILRRMG